MNMRGLSAISVEANFAQAKLSASGRNQNRMHVQKALMEYLLLGHVDT
jgi:hypothetical protein